MKKILTGLACVASFSTFVSADFLRAEMGVGAWSATPKGQILGTTTGFNGVDTAQEDAQTNVYAWALVKHFVPVVPNLRVEYVDITSEGKATGSLGGVSIPTSTNTQIDMTQVDLIPYYNILDNTFWITLDVGLDIKMVDVSYTVDPVVGSDGYSSSETLALPLGYVRGRLQVPTSGFGVEADIKYIEYDSNIVYDVRAKVDYTFDISPVIQPAVEVGYRMQKYQTDETKDIALDLDYSGVYAGVALRF
ncbi:MAG: TIGR04219 family outer membrane beta-barrel protein [Helicobacteraceae bacterium]|nr:TIGR04219 family outer membrane beta-barrel protein [Helicobacteraceae bacterium]